MDSKTFRPEMMGTIFITDDVQFIRTIPTDMVTIISLDEDNSVVDPREPNVVPGTCLLPPVDCLIAESDGDEDLYNIYYNAHLSSEPVQQFMAAIIAALYMKKNILLYTPKISNDFSVTKLLEFLYKLYGIDVGFVGQKQCNYDSRCIPIWMNLMYQYNIITPEEYLYSYPPDAPIPQAFMNKLMAEIRPVGETYNDRVAEIMRFADNIRKKPNIIRPIYRV